MNGDGTQSTTVYTGSLGSPVWERTTTDMLGRTVRVERPGYSGVEVAESFYNDIGQLVRSTSPGMADTLYLYDEVGDRVASGLDVDGNGSLITASEDRMTWTETSYEQVDGTWWSRTESWVYAEANSPAATSTGVQLSRVSGLGGGLVGESRSIDISGNETVTRRTLSGSTETTVTDYPDSTIDSSSTSIGGLLVSSTSKSGVTTRYSYDPLGRRIGVTEARTGTTEMVYNDQGRLDHVTDPAGNTTWFGYDGDTGRKISETNALGNETYYAYDDMNRMTHTWGDSVYPVAYVYDDYGRRTEMHTFRQDSGFDNPVWPGGTPDITRWHYQEATGLLTAKEDAAGEAVTYTYGEGGRLATRAWARDGGGIVTSYGYHPATGELLGIDYNDATPDVGFAYDRLGRQTTITDAAGTRLFAYNDALQLESETITGLYNRVITRRYEESGVRGRAVGFNVGAHYAVDYAYDNAGRLNTVGWNANGVQDTASYSYLASSNLLSGMTTGAGQSTTYAYEPKRNVKTSVENRFDGAVVSKYDYVYDHAGRRTSVVNSGAAFAANGDAFSLYEYNDRNELVESSRYRGGDIGNLGQPVGEEYRGYGYDPIGNRTQSTEGNTPYTYVSNALNQYVDVNGVVPVHDDDGNMTEMDGVSYAYNGENRLTSIQPETPANGDVRLDFTYDYMGRRVEKTKSEYAAGTWTEVETTSFVYDGWNMVEEIGDVENKYYVWGLDLSQSLQGAGGIGGLIVSVDGDANAFYFQYDANGNVGQLVDGGDSSIAARYEYDAFGNTVVADGPEAAENPYRFSTKYTDESGMVYYGYRYYLPEVGRWLNRDPIGEAGGVNLYGFVLNSPSDYTDYLGEEIKVFPGLYTRLGRAVRLSSIQSNRAVEKYANIVMEAFQEIIGDCAELTVEKSGVEELSRLGKNKERDVYKLNYIKENPECICSNDCWQVLKKWMESKKRTVKIHNWEQKGSSLGSRYTGDVYINPRIRVSVLENQSDGSYDEERIPFSIVLWHEAIGHGAKGLEHPQVEANFISTWDGKYLDPTLEEENRARKCTRKLGKKYGGLFATKLGSRLLGDRFPAYYRE